MSKSLLVDLGGTVYFFAKSRDQYPAYIGYDVGKGLRPEGFKLFVLCVVGFVGMLDKSETKLDPFLRRIRHKNSDAYFLSFHI